MSTPPRPRTPRAASFRFERPFWEDGYGLVAGVDEVGRGPLAGPVVCAAVILRPGSRLRWYSLLADSKLVPPARRLALFQHIVRDAVAVAAAVSPVPRVDEINILQASREAMTLAVEALDPAPDALLVDALTLPLDLPQAGIIDGDEQSRSIAAASIVAKVIRDDLMQVLDGAYPGYGFASHKGYAAPEHLEALERLGPCPLHRQSFEPVRLAAQRRFAAAWWSLGEPAAG